MAYTLDKLSDLERLGCMLRDAYISINIRYAYVSNHFDNVNKSAKYSLTMVNPYKGLQIYVEYDVNTSAALVAIIGENYIDVISLVPSMYSYLKKCFNYSLKDLVFAIVDCKAKNGHDGDIVTVDTEGLKTDILFGKPK